MGEKRRRKKAGNKAVRYFRAIQVTAVTAGETKEKHGINFRRSGMGVKRTKRMGVKGKKGRKIKRLCNKNWEIKTGRKRGKENKVGNTCSRTDGR